MKTILITGTGSGIGKAINEVFESQHEWNTIGISSRKRINILNNIDIDMFFCLLEQEITKLDVLVNNAGVFQNRPFTECTLSEIDYIIDTNLKGTIHVTHEALRLMKPGSRIINIGSVAGTHGIRNQAAYCASKFGLAGFTESLQQELQEKGILCTMINPGGVDTPLWNDRNPYPGDRSKLLKPTDIANLVWYIANLPANVVFKNATIYPSNENH